VRDIPCRTDEGRDSDDESGSGKQVKILNVDRFQSTHRRSWWHVDRPKAFTAFVRLHAQKVGWQLVTAGYCIEEV